MTRTSKPRIYNEKPWMTRGAGELNGETSSALRANTAFRFVHVKIGVVWIDYLLIVLVAILSLYVARLVYTCKFQYLCSLIKSMMHRTKHQ